MSELPISVSLDWQGGFRTEDILPDIPGLYAITSRRYGDERPVLYDIGRGSERGLRTRWRDSGYPSWLERLVLIHGGEIHYAIPEQRGTGIEIAAETIEDVERTLIWLHLPPANSAGINAHSVALRRHLRISNSGSVEKYLLPHIDTRNDWYGLRSPFRATGPPAENM